jgi:hypothetical protein
MYEGLDSISGKKKSTVHFQDILKNIGVLCAFLLWINTQLPFALCDCIFFESQLEALTGMCLVPKL